MDFITPYEAALLKVARIKELRAKSGRSVEELVKRAAIKRNELRTYAVEVMVFDGNTPSFRTHILNCASSAEAVRLVAETEMLEDIEEVDPSNTTNSILSVRRIHGAPKQYSEKDMLSSWHYILKHLKHGVILQNGTEINVSNKGAIAKLLTEKYKLRSSNYLVELYNKGRYNYNV